MGIVADYLYRNRMRPYELRDRLSAEIGGEMCLATVLAWARGRSIPRTIYRRALSQATSGEIPEEIWDEMAKAKAETKKATKKAAAKKAPAKKATAKKAAPKKGA